MKFLTPYLTPFLIALSLLTRIPVQLENNLSPKQMGQSALFYPLIGGIIGALLYLPTQLFNSASALVLSAIILTFWATITGGLHLDGLADSADGWLGGGNSEEQTRKIMKDPLVGSAGVIATVCILLLKFSAVVAIIQAEKAELLLFAPILGRSIILLLFISTPYAHKGMAQDVVTQLPQNLARLLLGICFLISFLLSLWATLLVLFIFWRLRQLMIKRLSGNTGDTLGASVEISEAVFLIGCALSL